jgi:hypothetical protein
MIRPIRYLRIGSSFLMPDSSSSLSMPTWSSSIPVPDRP